jgi:hypothetical protein
VDIHELAPKTVSELRQVVRPVFEQITLDFIVAGWCRLELFRDHRPPTSLFG